MKHLAVAIELSPLGYHQRRRSNLAADSRRGQQFNTLARNDLTINLTADLEPVCRYVRHHNRRRSNLDVVAGNLSLGLAANCGDSPEIDLSRNSGPAANAGRT